MARKTTTPRAAKKEANRKAAADARKIKAKELKALRDSGELDLDEDEALASAFASLTTHYSEGNAMLILLQAAMLGLKVRGLADVGGWNAFIERGRTVRDDQKSNRMIYIWYKITNPAKEADLEETSADGKRRDRFAIIGIYHVSQTEPTTVEQPAEVEQAAAVATLDADRLPGETRRDYAKRTYTVFVNTQYEQAEQATRGHLLTPAARDAAVDARDLFRGRADVAMRHASDELRAWWESNPRRTLAEHTALIMGGAA